MASETARSAQVIEQLSLEETALTQLTSAIELLEKQLAPVLRESVSEGMEGAKEIEEADLVPLACGIRKHSRNITWVRQRISSILDRLEL